MHFRARTTGQSQPGKWVLRQGVGSDGGGKGGGRKGGEKTPAFTVGVQWGGKSRSMTVGTQTGESALSEPEFWPCHSGPCGHGPVTYTSHASVSGSVK